jgi:hypothetical protein
MENNHLTHLVRFINPSYFRLGQEDIIPRTHPWRGLLCPNFHKYIDGDMNNWDIDIKKLSVDLESICKDKAYVVAIPSNSINQWEYFGLLKYVIQFARLSQTDDPFAAQLLEESPILVEFPLINTEGVFVRDHKFWSPRYQGLSDDSDWRETAIEALENRKRYLESTVQYGQHLEFEVPEIWVPHAIPKDTIKISDIKVDEINYQFNRLPKLF